MNHDLEILKVPTVGLGGFLTSLKLKLFIATVSDPGTPLVVVYAPAAVALVTVAYVCAKIYFLFKNKGRSPD